MTTARFSCFVASAFDRPDVDAVFDRCITRVLKQLRISPHRVDRVEHNEDIDEMIFQLIRKADLCIADLTHARPSVYFEAGYAIGLGKEVVFVCRSDHLRPSENDPAGNLRVHFDLQMKNIISWVEPNEAFSRRLERRLRHVLRPLETARRFTHRVETDRQEFERLSQSDQLFALTQKAQALLRARRYTCVPARVHTVEPAWSFLATCRIDSLRKRIIFLGVPTLGGRVVRRIAAVGLWPFQDDGYNTPDEGHYVVASLRSVPRSRIAEALPHSHWVNDSLFHMPCHPGSDGSSRAVYFHLFDNIRSLLEFADRFRLLPLLHDGCYGGA